MNTYYDRVKNADGSFGTESDKQNERAAARQMGLAWNCIWHEYAQYSPVDWWFEREGDILGVGEIKCRTHPSNRFPTVFLNLRKWLSLRLAELGTGKMSVFVAGFTDGVWWIRTSDIDARALKIGGCREIVKSANDIEPVIHIPIGDMKKVADSP